MDVRPKLVLNQGHQGDILIERVTEIPKTAKRVKDIGAAVVIAHGEQGNTHQIIDILALAAIAAVHVDGENIFVTTQTDGGAVVLDHECHAPAVCLPGETYLFGPKYEYEPGAPPKKTVD